MSENSEKAAKTPEELPTNPEEPLKQLAPTEKTEKKAEAAETTPEPKGRGRPKGSRDAKPRIKRIPVEKPPEEVEGEATAAAAKPKPVKKTARVQEEPEEQEPEQTREEPETTMATASLPEEPVQVKSPRSQRRAHMQALAAERFAATQARQVRYDAVIDRFLGY